MKRHPYRIVATFVVLLLLVASLVNVLSAPFVQAGAAVYPDLQTPAPDGLRIDRRKLADGKYHYLLRFNNTVENHGGPLEIVADLTTSRDLFQNVYDAVSGGTIVEHRRMTSDLIFHPTHNHFHVSEFADYSLFKRNSSGVYRSTAFHGTKTSFCVLDSIKWDDNATDEPAYTDCNAQKQGLTAGWGDIYTSSLPDQWIDFGTTMIADGDYALHSTVDSVNHILESNEGNNSGVAQFAIVNGELKTSVVQTPYCSAQPESAQIGTTVFVSCFVMPAGEAFSIRWRRENASEIVRATADADGEFTASFALPASTRGAHYVYVSNEAKTVKVQVVVTVTPTATLSITRGSVGRRVDLSVSGFSATESIAVSFEQESGTFSALGTFKTESDGSGLFTISVPSAAAGLHRIKVQGAKGSDPVFAEFTVTPTIKLSTSSAVPGGSISPKLRGFGSHDEVVLRIKETGKRIGTVQTTVLGAADPNAAKTYKLPTTLAPGTYTITAVGGPSGVSASTTIRITGVAAAQVPTETASPTPTPTPATTATAQAVTEIPTSSPTEIPSVASGSPTPTPSDVPSVTATETPDSAGGSETPVDGQTPEPDASPGS